MKNLILLILMLAPVFSSGNSQIITAGPPLTLVNGLMSMPSATASRDGYLTLIDWTTFNSKLTSPLTTKGDLLVFGASANVRFPACSNGEFLSYNSGTSTGLTCSAGGGGATWGAITGTLSNQTDLQAALDLKAPLTNAVMLGTLTSAGYHLDPAEYSAGSAPSNITVDWSHGNTQAVTVTGDIAITMSNAIAGATVSVYFDQDSVGNHTYTFTDPIEWGSPGAPTPSGANRTDWIQFTKRPGAGGYFVANYTTNFYIPGTWSNGFSTQFNGSSQYVNMGNNLGFQYTDPFCAFAWVKPSSIAGTPTILGKLLGTGAFSGWLMWLQASGKVTFSLTNTYGSNYAEIKSTSAIVNTSAWQQVGVCSDGTGKVAGMKIFYDGAAVATDTDADSLSASILNSSNFEIGSDNAGDFYTGLIDEVTIWTSNIGSSAGNITALWNSGVASDPTNFGFSNNLAHYYRMGDSPDANTGAGGIVDRAGSVNGTAVATPTFSSNHP